VRNRFEQRSDGERDEADLFLADLLAQAGPARGRSPRGAARRRAKGPAREPFFGDAAGDSWRIAARGGDASRSFRPRAGDLLVERAPRAEGPAWRCTPIEEIDLASLHGYGAPLRKGALVLRRVPAGTASGEDSGEDAGPIAEACGFFGPNVRRTEAEIRDAVVSRAQAEWTAWHTAAGAPRKESDVGMFGRLVGYYLATNGTVPPDALVAIQTAALGAVDYGALLAAGASAAKVAAETEKIRTALLAGLPSAAQSSLTARVVTAISHAREAFRGTGGFSAWSAAFVVTSVRGAAVAQGIEALAPPGNTHVGRDALLLAAVAHRQYTQEAYRRRMARPRRMGTYLAFEPNERAPRRGDIVVQDRRDPITEKTVVPLAKLATLGGDTHGDIVIDVQPGFVVTLGGNVGDSVRKRRYPLDAQGFLAKARGQLFAQENDDGVLPDLPPTTTPAATASLESRSTARIFALLSPVEDCAAVPGQAVPGGVLV
jgi:hypothetical protein